MVGNWWIEDVDKELNGGNVVGKLMKKGFAVLMLATMLSWAPGSQVSEASWLGDVIGVLVGAGSSSSSSSSGKSSSTRAVQSDGTDSNWVSALNSDQKLFVMAIENRDYGVAQEMLDAGVNINAVYPNAFGNYYVGYADGGTAFMYAVQQGDRQLQQWLLTHGANVRGYYGKRSSSRCNNSFIPYIVYAARYNNLELVTYLHNWGASINEVDGWGYNALLACLEHQDWSSYENKEELVRYLVAENIDMNQRTVDGRNMIEIMVRSSSDSYIPLIRAAAQAGVNVNNVNSDGMTPYKIALKERKLEKAKVLRELGGH